MSRLHSRQSASSPKSFFFMNLCCIAHAGIVKRFDKPVQAASVEIDMTGSLESRDLRALGGIITGPNAIRSGEILVSRLLDGEGYEGSDHIDFVPTHSEVYDEFENKLAEASGLGNGSKAFIIYEGYLILAFGDPEKQVIKCIGFPVAPDRAAAAGMKIDVKKESVRSGRRKLR